MIPTTKLTVTYSDGRTEEVVVRPRTQIAFERHYNIAIAAAFDPESSTGMRLEHMYFMAYHASKSAVEFDDWVDTVDGIDVEVEGTVDPTPPVPSAGS